MDDDHDPFRKANYHLHKSAHARWHRHQSKLHILRSQLGFCDVQPSRPKVCQGCQNYHGIPYGYSRETRTVLICGLHPYGWQSDQPCPDWTVSDDRSRLEL